MSTSAEQLHHGPLSPESGGNGQRLYIDLDVCTEARCEECTVQCSYYFHRGNNGIRSIAELATYALVCRRCEEPHCVNACPHDALEQQKDHGKLLVRHAMRCVSCRTCSHACPYGTIYPEHVPLLVHNCDFCLGRRELEGEPLCAATCPSEAIRLDTEQLIQEKNCFQVGEHLTVHSTHWEWDKA